MITKFYHSNEELLAALNVGVTNESLEVVTEGDYSIYNYGIDVQFKKLWTPLTRMCRGLVVNNKTGEILADLLRSSLTMAKWSKRPFFRKKIMWYTQSGTDL